MKLLIFIFGYITLCSSLIYGQQIDTIEVHQLEQKATELYETFKFDSAAHYYFQAAELNEQKENWLFCVKSYRLTANSFIKALKPDTALYFSQKALDIVKDHFLEKKLDEASEMVDILTMQGLVYVKLNQQKKGLEYYKEALDLLLRTDSLAKLKETIIWNEMGNAYRFLGKYEKAMDFYRNSLEVRKKLLGNNHIDVAENLNYLGIIYQNKGEFEKALEYYKKALHIRILTYGEYHPEVAVSYNNIGMTYGRQQKNEKALEYYQKALNIRTQALGEYHSSVADLYNNMGIAYKNNGNYDKALDFYKKALQIRIQTIGEQHPDVATSYNNMGIVYYYKGNYNKSIEYQLKSLKIKIKTLDKLHPKIATGYLNIGMIYYYKGDYEKALEYSQKALQIYIQALGEIHPHTALGYNNIGMIYDIKHEYDKAMVYYQKSLQIDIQIFGKDHLRIAGNYVNIGTLYSQKEDYEKALEHYLKSLQIRINAYGNDHPNIADNYDNIGLVYSKKGDYDKALEYTQKALQIRIQIFGKYHPKIARSYNNTGTVYLNKNDYSNALKNYQKALIANLINFNDTNIYHNPESLNALSKQRLLEILNNKANAFYQLYSNNSYDINDLYTSLLTYELAFKLIYEMRNDYNHESTQLLLSENTKNIFEEAIQVALELNKMDTTGKIQGNAFEFLEKSKSATLSAYLNNIELKQYSNIADSLLEKEKNIAINRHKYETKIQQAKSQKEGYDTLLVQNYQDKLFDNSRQYDSLMNTMKHNYPDYFILKYQQETARVEKIQQQLDKNSALINYFVGDTSLFICIITKEEYTIETVKTDSLFNEKIIDYYIDIKSDFTEKELKNSAYLYNHIIKPVEEHLENKNNLIIIPDGNLYYVPFETLCKNDTYNDNLSALNYLIKSYSINYHHTATLWLNSREKGQNLFATEDNFIGFAPVFDPKINNGFIVSSEWIPDTTDMELATRSISRDFTYLNPLEYSEDEVKSIVKLFNKQKKEAKGFFYQEANEENFKQNVQNYKYIHIATHSFTNDLYPNLSGIAFSQPDTNNLNKEQTEDGILYAGETYNLNLQETDLIVLSSCKSGLGKLIQGEGFLSLSRGFLYSGAPNIMFSLWNVKDEQTKDLMIHFYKHVLQGTNYTSALREAKIQLINNPKTALPKYWGAWMLVGR